MRFNHDAGYIADIIAIGGRDLQTGERERRIDGMRC